MQNKNLRNENLYTGMKIGILECSQSNIENNNNNLSQNYLISFLQFQKFDEKISAILDKMKAPPSSITGIGKHNRRGCLFFMCEEEEKKHLGAM